MIWPDIGFTGLSTGNEARSKEFASRATPNEKRDSPLNRRSGSRWGVGGQLLQIGGKGHHQLGNVVHRPLPVGCFALTV